MKKKIQEYLTYITPKFIFIPFDDTSKLHIKKNKYVCNNMYLGKRDNDDNIFSPVSGYILGIKDIVTINGNCKSLVIENDFIDRKEKINYCKSKSAVLKMRKSEVIEVLSKFNFKSRFSKKNLVISSSYNKFNDLGDMVLNYEMYEEILETIDILKSIFNISSSYIHVNKNDLHSQYAIEKYINAFDNICVVNSINKISSKDIDYLSVEDVIGIYYALFKEYFYDSTFVTIFDKESIIVKVKVFTSIIELFKDLKISYKNRNIYINDKLCNIDENFIITRDIKSIVLK